MTFKRILGEPGSCCVASKKIYLGNQQTKEDGSKEYPWELCCDRRRKGKEGGGRGETSGLYTMDLKWDIVLVTLILTSLTIQRVTKMK